MLLTAGRTPRARKGLGTEGAPGWGLPSHSSRPWLLLLEPRAGSWH